MFASDNSSTNEERSFKYMLDFDFFGLFFAIIWYLLALCLRLLRAEDAKNGHLVSRIRIYLKSCLSIEKLITILYIIRYSELKRIVAKLIIYHLLINTKNMRIAIITNCSHDIDKFTYWLITNSWECIFFDEWKGTY